MRTLEGSSFTIDQVLDRWFVFLDPPDHERLRSVVNRGLQRATVERPLRISQIARSLIDRLPRSAMFDLLPAYVYPLATIAMAEVLGLPTQDCDRLITWAGKLMRFFDKPDPASTLQVHSAFTEFFSYVRSLAESDGSAGPQGLLADLLKARDAGSISDDEVVATSSLLLVASAETTPTLIGNSILLLLQQPEQLALLRESPTLLELAVDEVLRYESPVQFTGRHALADFELRGKIIHKGDYIVAFYNSANRDPEVFNDPETFDITRRENRHLGFGAGIHNCVGSKLGHLIAQIAVRELISMAPDIALGDRTPVWRGHNAMRGLRSLQVML